MTQLWYRSMFNDTYECMDDELKLRIKNMLRVSDYMLERVVKQIMSEGKDEIPSNLCYDIIAECQCRNRNGTL